jgi:DNA polymerase alpha subunit A
VTPEKPGYGKSDGGGKRKKAAYAGGLVLEPKKGLYDDYILLLDFNSLYPSIIQEYNLCFTTIDWAPLSADDSAAGSGNVSGSAKKAGRGGGGPIADDEEEEEEVDVVLEEDSGVQAAPLPDDSLPMGVLPRVIKSLVERRAQVKVMLKRERDPMQRQELDIRQKALKLTANSMYGCLGFGSSRFCAKPIAALITAKGREALQRAVDVTQRECGLEVIYGDTDSVMVSTNSRDIKQVKELGNQVKREVNKLYRSLELDLDGIFKCMLLLKKKKYAALVVVEGADGTITYEKEMKGLDLVRRDWCDLSKDTGRFVLDRILSGEAREEVVNDIHQHLSELADAMRAGQVPIGKYIITKGISKPPQDYPDHKRQPHLQVALAMQKAGMPVNAGNHIPYIICEEPKEEVEIEKTSEETDGEIVTPAPSAPKRVSSLPPAERAYHPDRVLRSEGRLIPDVEWYLSQQVVPPIGRLCEPIEGTNTAMLAEKMGLDSKSFSAGMGAGDEEKADDWAFTPTSRLTDEERFRACDPLIVRCFACKEEHAFLGVFRPVDASYVVLTPSDLVPGLSCPGKECGAPFWGAGEVDACFSLIYQRLSLAIREHQRRYGQAWMICDDTSCGRKTQQLSVCGAACTALGCTGRMNFAYSDSALYEQLKYYETLFDAPRAQERAIERWSLKRSDNTFPLSVEQRAVLDLLLIRIRHEVSNSAYNWIQPSLWSTVFSRKTAE